MHYKIDSKESSPKTNTVKDEEGKRKTNIVLVSFQNIYLYVLFLRVNKFLNFWHVIYYHETMPRTGCRKKIEETETMTRFNLE